MLDNLQEIYGAAFLENLAHFGISVGGNEVFYATKKKFPER